MNLRPCLGGPDGKPCGALSTRVRCPEHTRQMDAARGTPAERGYDAGWRRTAKAAIEAHVAVHGWRCLGQWCDGPHDSTDLVCDHDAGPMCRSGNARKAATADKARAAERRCPS